MPFSSLALGPEFERVFAVLGYASPFPVQAQAIPEVLAGKDLVVQAETGAGKTVAFLAPVLRLLMGVQARRRPRALVLVPTRELAMQVRDRAVELAQYLYPFKIRAVYGGVSVNTQMLALRGGADLVVATPGRLLDLVRQNALSLADVRHLVIDEADKLLNLGFIDEMCEIQRLLNADRQTLLFSATMNSAVQEVVRTFLRAPLTLQVEPAQRLAVAIAERAYLVPTEQKGPFLRELLGREDWSQVLVFVSSARRADNVSQKLSKNGIRALSLHGDKNQGARTDALQQFRSGHLRVLVATDLLSRGIDVSGLPCVINYDLPRSVQDYVHRIGRTGRAGLHGTAISLVGPEEEAHLRLIEKKTVRQIARESVNP